MSSDLKWVEAPDGSRRLEQECAFEDWLDWRVREAKLLRHVDWVETDAPADRLLDRTSEYARWVLAGGRIAGELEILACRRHLDDIETGPARNLIWKPAEAEKTIDAYPANFCITDGPNYGLPFELLPWMVFTAGSAFGWFEHDPDTGQDRWRFDFVWVELGKGQGKSPFSGATGLLVMAAFGRKRAQVYTIAPIAEQALVIVQDAAAFCQAPTPVFDFDPEKTFDSQGTFLVRGVGENVHSILHKKSGSSMQAKGGKATTTSGTRPALVLPDEVHEMTSIKTIDMWVAHAAKIAEGSIVWCTTNTPGTDQLVGVHYSDMASDVLRGRAKNDRMFALICAMDEADVAEDPETGMPRCLTDWRLFRKALPALGRTFPEANIRREVDKAAATPSERPRVLRLYGGWRTASRTFWMSDPAFWDRALAPVDETKLTNLPCWLGLDLAEKNDLTALAALWMLDPDKGPETSRYAAKVWYWTPQHQLEKRAKEDGMPYDVWQPEGLIEVVAGAVIEFDFVARTLGLLLSSQRAQLMAIDPYKADEFLKACKREGVEAWLQRGDETQGRGLRIVPHGQGTKVVTPDRGLSMPVSVDQLDDLLRQGRLTIDSNKINTACASNATILTDAQGNRAFQRGRGQARIDGLVALTMAIGASNVAPKKRPASRVIIL